MSVGFPWLTLFLGPASGHGTAINSAVRVHRAEMGVAGLKAYPKRAASPALRGLSDPNKTLDERREAYFAMADEGPAFYSALNFLDTSRQGFRQAELFDDAEIKFGALAEVAGQEALRIAIAIDNLPDLFIAARSDLADRLVREMGWENLYEASWAELIEDAVDALPGAEFLVLTHAGVAKGGVGLLERLFGPGAGVVDGRAILRDTLSVTGQAVLERMGEGTPPNGVAEELYGSFADRADLETCKERLGIDRLTHKLLMHRYDEDLARIGALDRVEVI